MPNRGRPRVYTDEELLESIQQFHSARGRVPVMGELSHQGMPSAGTYVRRFGSWANAVEAAGFERPKRGPRKWYKR